jgi:hypothetical protein
MRCVLLLHLALGHDVGGGRGRAKAQNAPALKIWTHQTSCSVATKVGSSCSSS